VSRDKSEEYGMTELKHLLTAASEDRPPGIDLLDGLSLTARRRPARRRPFAIAGLAAGVVAAGVGIALTTSAGTPQSAQAKVLAAVAQNDGKTYHVEVVTYIRGGDPRRLTGDFDPQRRAGRLTSQTGGQLIMIGDLAYQRLPASIVSSKGLPPVTAGPDGKIIVPKTPKGWKPTREPLGSNAWLKLPLNKVRWGSPSQARPFAQDPQGELKAIRSANRIVTRGPVSGPGWKGERYSFTTPSVKKWFGHQSSSGTVDVDSSGNVRKLDVTLAYPDVKDGADSHFTVTFSAYGGDVTVTEPETTNLYTQETLYYQLHGKQLPAGMNYGIALA
jgi:hypothetical protein